MKIDDEIYKELTDIYWDVLSENRDVSRFKDEFYDVCFLTFVKRTYNTPNITCFIVKIWNKIIFFQIYYFVCNFFIRHNHYILQYSSICSISYPSFKHSSKNSSLKRETSIFSDSTSQ